MFHCEAKPLALDPGVGLDPKRHYFALGIPTCWYLQTRNFALPPTQNLKFAFPPTRNPKVSQWNIGCIGCPTQGSCIGHVDFMLFIPSFFASGTQWNAVLSGIWAYRFKLGRFSIFSELIFLIIHRLRGECHQLKSLVTGFVN